MKCPTCHGRTKVLKSFECEVCEGLKKVEDADGDLTEDCSACDYGDGPTGYVVVEVDCPTCQGAGTV